MFVVFKAQYQQEGADKGNGNHRNGGGNHCTAGLAGAQNHTRQDRPAKIGPANEPARPTATAVPTPVPLGGWAWLLGSGLGLWGLASMVRRRRT